MKRNICGLLIAILVLMGAGIIGGTEWFGEPLTNLFWLLPIGIAMWLVAKIGGFDNY